MKRACLAVLFSSLAGFSQSAAAQEFGRLFFTPEQRAALDARRKARVPDKPAAVTVASPTTRLDGFVKRSGGPATVFVNGESLSDGGADSPRIAPAGEAAAVSLPVGETGARVTLKPGEILDRGNGEIRGTLGEGEIKVRRAPGK